MKSIPILGLVSLAIASSPAWPGQANGQAATMPAEPYSLGTGDRLKITTYGEEKLTGEFTVNGEGVVPFPLVGDVPARGRSLAEFRADLVARLGSQFLRHPSVTVEVLNFRPVFVLGEVAKPGSFAYVEGMTVFGLVSMAGGFTYRANTKRVSIRHEDRPTEVRQTLDSATRVRPGDTIRIVQRFF